LYLLVAPYGLTGGGSYGIRAQVFSPPVLSTTAGQSLPLTLQTTITAGQSLVYRVNVTPGQTYYARWASYSDPYGGIVATAYVTVNVSDTKATLLSSYSSGYTNPPTFKSTQDHIYVTVTASTGGSFMLGVGTP
jgi:hypothetical protein